MKNIIGFRQYLNSQQAFKDLETIIAGQNKYFPASENFKTIVAVCGQNPRDFLEQKNLLSKVAFYYFAPWEESAKRVSEVYKKSFYHPDRVQIVYYNEQPMGLTYPLELLIRIGNLMNFENVAVSDSDFQMSYAEIRRVYDLHLAKAKHNEAVITYPRRARRSLDSDKYPINRWAMEDLENLYIYMLSDLKALKEKADFQSGLSITSRAANMLLNFDRVGSWIGNLHMAIQVIRNKGRLLNEFKVDTNVQNESTINFKVQCAKIDQLFKYYMIPLSNIIHLALSHPEQYLMDDWTKGKSKEELGKTIYAIQDIYEKYKLENGDS